MEAGLKILVSPDRSAAPEVPPAARWLGGQPAKPGQ